ncbi:MAG TPA: ABC transporter permease [Gemmatimonadales bacterium]|nr:ABC transporter permease [Gemmatimonadales bacterium]
MMLPARWEAFAQDLRYAVRGLKSRPGFTLGVILTLALGIGANAAMFSVVDRLLLRPPPLLQSPERVHRVYLANMYRGKEFKNGGVQYARFADLTRWTTSFDRTAEFTTRELAIGVGTDAHEMTVGAVSASFFACFDAPPVLGRYFTSAEDTTPTGAAVAVLSYGLWQTRYGGSSDVLGETLQVGATLYTIIGVTPRGFAGLWPGKPPAVYVPITAYGAESGANLGLRGENWWQTYHWTWASMLVVRKPSVTVADAEADLTAAYKRSYLAALASSPHMPPIEVERPRAIAGSVLEQRGPNASAETKVATWLTGVAAIVWLIACANVANLLLARALHRRREIAVRLALGVSRGRLAVQLLTESLLLALLGGGAGLLVAQWGGTILRTELLGNTAGAGVVSDPRSLLFVGIAVLLTGLGTGLAPILQTRRADLTQDLKAGEREGGVQRSRLRAGLLVFKGALSVVLLVGAGLFVRSLQHVKQVRLGYDPDSVLVVDLRMRGVQLDSAHRVALRRQLLASALAIPGVAHVSRQVTMPFWSTWNEDLHVAGIDSVDRLGEFDLNAVSTDYFATMGTRLLRGRAITDQDAGGAPRVMVVSMSMARVLWPDRDPLGACIRIGGDTVPCTTVVGVAEDIKSRSLGDEPAFFYYLSADQFNPDGGGLFVRIRDAARARETVRRALQPIMPGPSYVTVTPISDAVSGETQSWRLGATLFSVFGLLALVLAAIGLYSVIAYNVAWRTHEMGVRVALGAGMRDIVRLVLTEGVVLAGLGVALGTVIALIVGRWVAPLLFEESPRDPAVFVFVAATLLAVALVASLAPARRAGRVDPMQALRSE